MKKIKTSLILLALLLPFFTSCKKEDVESARPITYYFPISVGNNWSEAGKVTVQNLFPVNYNQSVIYFELDDSGPFATLFLSPDELRWENTGGITSFLFYKTIDFPRVILQRPLVKGHSWSELNNSNGLFVKSTITSTNSSVFNSTFGWMSDVLVVSESYTYPPGYPFSPATEPLIRNLYYAGNVGLVNIDGIYAFDGTPFIFEINAFSIP